MNNLFRLALGLVIGFGFVFFPVNSAWALTLDEAKVQGLIGEKPNGYLAPVSENSKSDVQALVKDINQKRKAHYKEIAKKNGTELGAVEVLAGKKAIEKTASGNYIQTPQGTWKKK